MYSTSCTDCSTEGLILTLNGRQDVVNKVQCRTNNLDHGGQVDYDAGDALFDDKLTLGTFTPDGGCLDVNPVLTYILSNNYFFRLLWMVQYLTVNGSGQEVDHGKGVLYVLSGLVGMCMHPLVLL